MRAAKSLYRHHQINPPPQPTQPIDQCIWRKQMNKVIRSATKEI